MPVLIIDGYNVIYSLDRYRGIQKKDREAAVEMLVRDLVNLTGSAGIDIAVVFDGRQSGSETKTGRLRVIYSSDKQSADAVIERLVFEADIAQGVAVCTGDYAQQKVVGRRGVRRMAPRELDDMLAERSEQSLGATKGSQRNRLEDRLPEEVKRKLDSLRRPRRQN